MSGTPPVPPAPPSTPWHASIGIGSALSEEARLRAQRRFLEERFGSVDPAPSSDRPDPSAPVTSATDPSSPVTSEVVTPASVVVSEARPPLPASAVAAAVAAAAIEARSEQQGDENDTDDPRDDDTPQTHPTDDPVSLVWPGSCYPPRTENIIFDSDVAASLERKMPVKIVTKFARAYPTLPSNHIKPRRIAVDPKLISYSIDRHVRVIGRVTADRTILKGHNGPVVDMCFSRASELPRYEGASVSSCVSLLASCATDGSVILWFLDTTSQGDGTIPCYHTVKLDHPTPGCHYSRISICSHSKSARFALVDAQADEIRVVMDVTQRKIVEETLKGKPGTAAQIADVTWLNSSTLVSCAITGQAHVWNVESGQCTFAFAPVTQPSTMEMAFGLSQQSFILVADSATKIQLWSRDRTGQAEKYPSLSQEVNLIAKQDPRNIAVLDPLGEFLVVSSVGSGSLFVLHVDKVLSCVTCITEVPMKKVPLTVSLTRTIGSVVRTDARGVREAKTEDELGFWSIHEKSVQLQSLNADLCRPRHDVTEQVPSSIAPSHRSHVGNGEADEANELERPATESQGEQQTPAPIEPVPRRVAATTSPVEDEKETPAREVEYDTTSEKAVSPPSAADAISGEKSQVSAEAIGAEISRCMELETDATIRKLEQQFAEREEQEKQQYARLLANVESTAKANVAFFAGEALHGGPSPNMLLALRKSTNSIVSEALGNDSLSKAIDDCLASTSDNPVSGVVQQSLSEIDLSAEIRHSLEKSGLQKNYEAACDVMASQIAGFVEKEIEDSLVGNLVQSLDAAQAAALRLEQASNDWTIRLQSGPVKAADVDHRELVQEFLAAGNCNRALVVALESDDDALLEWFLDQLDGSTLSNEPPAGFSNVALLAILSNLSGTLEGGEVMKKLEWMIEAFLNTDLDDPELQGVFAQTLGKVDRNIDFLVGSDEPSHQAERKKARVLRRLMAASAV